MFEGKYFFKQSNKYLFFLPPPHIKIFLTKTFFFLNNNVSESPRILAVNSVRVAAPSSIYNPLEKEMSKSFVSKEAFSLFILFE